MFLRNTFILLSLIILQSCVKTHYSINNYKETTKAIEKKYKIKRADLILTYDLANIDNNKSFYFKTLGLIANEKNHAKSYLLKFHSKYKSESKLAKEGKKRIVTIATFLLKLQNKYHLLNNKNANHIRKLMSKNLKKLNVKSELSKLDLITSSIPLMLPIYNGCITSAYGKRKNPFTGKDRFHCGTDIAGKVHAPVYSSANGKVKFVGTKNGYGKIVEIDHGNGIKTKYAHLHKSLVTNNQNVIRGQIIGLQGATGNARGEHLHFEIHLSGRHVNPYHFICHY